MRRDSLTRLAWLNVATHLLGCVLAAVGMRPGTPLAPLSERLVYLARSPLAWSLGWICWMFCAGSLIAFLALAVRRMGERFHLARLGLVVAVAAMGFDLLADVNYLILFPMLARMTPRPEVLFLVVERATGIASMVIANGGYSVAILLLTLDLRRFPGASPVTVTVGFAVFLFGALLAVAGLTGVPEHALWTTPPTMIAFCVWVLLVAQTLSLGNWE